MGKILKYGLPAVVLLGLLAAVLLGVGPKLVTYLLTDVTEQPPVPFLVQAPVVDGVLDADLAHLPARDFHLRFRLFRSAPATRYRIAYGVEFLYLFIEAEAAGIVARDRGYQNGDGFQLLLATPPRGRARLAERFYVLGFSPQDDPARAWARKVIWYHDGDTALSELPDDVLFAAAESDGKAGYELLLPWRVVEPYHPWVADPIGFNLCFVKAVGARGMVMDFVLFDWRLQAERKRRRYVPLSFEPPHAWVEQAAALPSGFGVEGEPLRLKVVSCGRGRSEEVAVGVEGADGDPAAELVEAAVHLPAGIDARTFHVGSDLPPGEYRMTTRLGEVEIGSDLLVFPRFDFGEIDRRLEELGEALSAGDRISLELARDEIDAAIEHGKLSERLLEKMTRLTAALEAPDTLYRGGAVVRRAFTSASDGTRQPYTLRLPVGYDPELRYPLLVFLHGSGVDDQWAAAGHDYLDERRYVQLFPYARGVSHNYASEEAQRDIREAIADVAAGYSVDTDRIVLAGFSMGGYGVYRTFWESPELFSALLVLSGDPELPWLQRKLTGGRYPPIHERPELFGDVPLFVFHGTEDRNHPFARTADFVDRLQASGACCVELHTEPSGHDKPRAPETLERLHAWLGQVAGGPVAR